MPIVNAYGKRINFPDDMSHEEIANVISANEKDLNPDYKPPSGGIREFAENNFLGFSTKEKPSIADQAEATADEGANTAAPQVKGAPVRQSFYNKALLDPSIGINNKDDILARTRSAADEDIKGQVQQRELEGLRTDDPAKEQPRGISGLIGNIATGAKQTGRMAAATINAFTNDNKEVENLAKESGESSLENTPIEQSALLGDLRKIDREQGAIGQIGDTLSVAAKNKMGTGQMVAEQLPNSAVALGAGYAGFKTGASAGAVFGPVGATIGGTLGFVGGMFLGNVLLEAGGKAIEKASDEDGFTPQDRDSALREGAIKAGVITGVDAATFKLGGMLANKLGYNAINAGARAEAKILIDAGVDVTSLSAINAALKSSPQLFKAAKVAGERAALGALSTGRKAAILGTGAALETVGEFAGEAGGEYVATGKADYVDATIEALSSATMSIAETAYNYNKVASGNDLSPEGIQKAVNSINDVETKESIDKIKKATNIDEAINAANESVSRNPVNKDDVLRVADPSLADIERLTGLKPSESILEAERQQSILAQARQENIAAQANLEGKNNSKLKTQRDTEIVLPDNRTLKAQWDIVDADNVKASLKNGESQPRDRTRAASDLQIQSIAKNPDYRRLSDSPVMDIGAPVLSNDGQIVGGNGRFEALSRAYDQSTAQEYLDNLRQDAIKKGIDPSVMDQMKKPVLVRRVSQPFDTRELAIASNSGTSAQYSDLEQAKIDSERLKSLEDIVTTDNGDIALTPDNIKLVRDALGKYSPAEVAPFVDSNGQLSQQGMKRIRNAMLAKAYGDNKVIQSLIESNDSDIRNILGALTRVVGDAVKAQSTAPKESDVTPSILEAINIYSQLKQKNQPVSNYLQQQDAFSDKVSPAVENILMFLDKNARSQPKITEFFRDAYAKLGSIDTKTADIFGEQVKPKPEDLFAKPTIESQLEKHLKKNGYEFDVKPVTEREFNELDNTKKAQKELAEKQAKIFGKKVVFVKTKGKFGINGVMVPAIKDTIFIDLNTPKPFHAVMAHELSHWMEQENPKAYKDMLAALKDIIINESGYSKKYGITDQTEGLIHREIAGDLMGDNFTKPEFWKKVAEYNPSKFKEIAQNIIKWLKNIVLKAKARGMGSEEWVTDAKKAQDIIAKAVSQYTKEQDAKGGDVKFHRAFHGSPHDHNKFDSANIGTGEGAQAYGYGHYFADIKELAEYYREKLSDNMNGPPDRYFNGTKLKLHSPEYHAATLLSRNGMTLVKAREDVKRWIGEAERDVRRSNEVSDLKVTLSILEEAKNKKQFTETPYKGKLYEVELAPEQDEYLLWDKPLSEQSDKVKSAISNISDSKSWNYLVNQQLGGNVYDQATGRDLYKAIQKTELTDKKASEYLHSLGIRGIKYLDGTSRGKGEGNYNYVIFDDNDIEITAKFSKQEKLPDTINIDGIERPTTNSEGKPIYPTEEGVRNFWKWFGDRKVVDDQGRPLVVYHTSPVDNIDDFAKDISTSNTSKGSFGHLGMFISRNKDIQYAFSSSNQPYKLYVKGNLLDTSITDASSIAEDFLNSNQGEDTLDNLESQGYDFDDSVKIISNEIESGTLTDINELLESNNFVNWVFENGYDGIDTGGNILVFDPSSQIKSAIGNNGEFSEGNNDIRFSKQQDDEYLQAVKDGDIEKAQKMVDSAARDKGYISGTEYRMMHQAPNREDYNLASIKESGIVPDDYWTHPQYYQSDATERESFNKVNSAIDRQKRTGKKAGLSVYRAVPKDIKDTNIRNGDWVTPSREYARMEGEGIPGGYRIISAIPNIDNLWWDANSINELGYDDGKEYAYKNTKNNRKLIDAITYDDDGNIIPLSKRFNSRSDDVRFSSQEKIKPEEEFKKEQPKPFNPNEDIEETKAQKAQRIGQDKFNRFRVVKEFLAKEKGINISEAADVYGAETRYYGKVANQQEDFRNKVRNPLIEKIAKAGYKLDEVEQYLLNRHAQEANAQNRKLTGKDDSTAYGISDTEAQAYLDKAPKELAKLADEVQALTDKAQQLRLDNGIETQERIDAMNGAYKYYVPVRGDAESQQKKTQFKGTGKGFSLKYKPKRRLGHELRNESVIENIFQDYERAIIQVEKNRIGKSLALMAAEIQMPELVSIEQPVKRKVLQTQKAYGVLVKGDLVDVFQTQEAANQNKQLLVATDKKLTLSDITIAPITDQRLIYSASPMLADNEVVVYMNGHEVRLQINDELMARAYKNMGTEALGSILSAGRAINGWMSKVYTGYNPEFILTNLQRDFQSGFVNLTGEQGILIAGKAVANYSKSFASLLKYAATGESDKWIDSYRENGGNTGAAYLPDLERLGQEVRKEYASYQGVIANLKEGDSANALRAAGRKTFNATLKYIEHLNAAGENAFRLATFKAMVESGKSVAESANMAKNVTVNFNRKGELGAELNALYLFFNASVQGTAATSHALFKGRHKYQAWGLVGSMMSIGYMSAAMLGGFDDEDEYDKVSDATKSRNLIMSYGDGYVKIPVPYGYGFFYNAGRMYADAQRKGEVGKMPYQLMALATEEFSPFNVASTEDSEFSSKKFNYGLLPTVVRIPTEITNNFSSFTGRELYPEKEWYKSEPDNEKMWRGTKGTVYDISAQYLASIGIEISPETLKFMTRTATGGSGAFVDTSVSAAMLKKEGAELETREIPFVRKFYGENSIQDSRARYGKAKDEARIAYEKFNALRQKGDIASVREFVNDKKELIALNNAANKMSDVIKIIRDQQHEIKLSDRYTTAEKRLKIKELEKQEEKYYDMFMSRYKQVKEK